MILSKVVSYAMNRGKNVGIYIMLPSRVLADKFR